MYDLDAPGILEKLKEINMGIKLTTNPCIEFWFLLHGQDQFAALSTDSCINLLKKGDPCWKSYEKGSFSPSQADYLWDKRLEAVKRGKNLKEFANPSSTIYRLIEAMETVRQRYSR
jgi:hypothetical protein